MAMISNLMANPLATILSFVTTIGIFTLFTYKKLGFKSLLISLLGVIPAAIAATLHDFSNTIFGDYLAKVLVGPLTEEFLKISIVLIIVKKDANPAKKVLFTTAIATGFAFAENAIWAIIAGDLLVVVYRTAPWMMHIAASSMGVLMSKKSLLLGLLVATGIHGINNWSALSGKVDLNLMILIEVVVGLLFSFGSLLSYKDEPINKEKKEN